MKLIATNPQELAYLLGLPPGSGAVVELRCDLNDKIVEVIKCQRLTAVQVAKLANTTKTCVTAILNRNTGDISTDLMLRVLASLGVHAKLRFTNEA